MANMQNMSPQAMAAWQALTQSWGQPLVPTSAYRDPAYNESVGGARGSQHIHGNAFDVPTAGMTPEQRAALIQQARAAGFQGFGGYDNSLHFDVGPSRTWGPDYTGATTPDWLKEALGSAPVQISTSGVNDMPMTPQQPMGLLGQLGIQKQDPLATDQTALPFYQRDRFKDSMGALAMAFNELRMNPSQAVPQAIMAGRENRAAEQQNNRTVEWLRSQPNGERFAQLAEAVGAGPALQMYQEAMKPQESFQTLSGQQLIDMGMAGANPNALYKVNQATGEISQVGGAGTTINMGDQLTPFDEAAQKFQVQMYGDMAASAPTAQATLGQVDMLDTLLSQGGSGFAQGLSQFVFDTVGIDTRGSAAAAANALISQLVPAQRPQGSGTMSDADLNLYRSSLPQLQASPEGNKIIVDGMRALAQYNLATSRIAAQVLNGQIDPATADKMIIDLGNPLAEVNDRIKAMGGQSAPAAGNAPAVGTVSEGYRFKGGDPADANNWEPI